jgi:hypothetical protein
MTNRGDALRSLGAFIGRPKVERLLLSADAAADARPREGSETAATEHEIALNGWDSQDRAVALEQRLEGLLPRRKLLAIDIIAMEIRYAQYDALLEAANRVSDGEARRLLLQLANEIILPKTK